MSQIGSGAFANNQLTSVTLTRVPKIGDGAFTNELMEALKIHFANSVSLAGTYIYQNNQWLLDGEAITGNYVTLDKEPEIIMISIDGNSANTYLFDNDFLVSPGFHTVVVSYSSSKIRGGQIITTTSQGSVTFEHRFFFSGSRYLFTGSEEGDKIIFRIEPK